MCFSVEVIVEVKSYIKGIITQRDLKFDTCLTNPYHPVYPNKVFGLLGPGWQVHVTHHGPVLPHSQMVAIAVDKHLREVVELRDQLLRFKRRRDVRVLHLADTTTMLNTTVFTI